jgi:hypothetical protein
VMLSRSAVPSESAGPSIGSIILSIIGVGGESRPSGISVIYPSAISNSTLAGNSSKPMFVPACVASRREFAYWLAGVMSLVGGLVMML